MSAYQRPDESSRIASRCSDHSEVDTRTHQDTEAEAKVIFFFVIVETTSFFPLTQF